MPKDAPPNGGAPAEVPERSMGSWQWVSEMQAKLHRWAAADPGRRFDDVFNFVHDPATLVVAFARVAGNRGANTPGVDGLTAAGVEQRLGVPGFLDDLRISLKEGPFRPLPVRERRIPKPGGSGKLRKLGIPTIADRVVQAALKLVLEPIFEADFLPVSYGFRPKRRAQDAIAEIHMFGSRGYQWVLDADIEACFDSIDHTALMDRVRHRIKDKRALALVKAFLKAGVMTETGDREDSDTGTPQGADPVPAPGQHRAVGARRARDGALAARRTNGNHRAPELPPLQGPADVADRALCGRFRRARARPGARCGGPARRHRHRAGSAGSSSIGGQDASRAYGGRVRLPGFPHPVETQARHEPVVRIHVHR